MKKILFLLIFCLGACQSPQPSFKTQKNKRPILEDILQQKTTKPSDVVGWLKICSKECLQPDAEIAGDLSSGYEVLFALAEKTPEFAKLAPKEKQKAMEAQKKVRSGFVKILKFKNGRDILQTAMFELVNPMSMSTGLDPEMEELVTATLDRLKNQPETRATGFYIQAISLPPTAENTLAIIEAYLQCYLVSGKSDQQCRDLYQDVVNFYERPRCKEGNFTKEIQFSVSFAPQKTILSQQDLLESTFEVIGPDLPGARHYEIWFNLKTFSSEKLEKVTKDYLGKKAFFLFRLNGKTYSQAQILQKITDGQFRMPFSDQLSAQLAFDRLCRKSTPDQIPVHLKIK